MEALIGITGRDFVIMAADRNAARSIVVMKRGEDKFRDLTSTCTLCYSGEPGSATSFVELLQARIRLHELCHETPLTVHAAAHYARRMLADELRTPSAYQTNLLVGGMERGEEGTGRLFWIDHLGTLTETPFAAHGYAAYFVLALLDRHYRGGLSVEEGMGLLKMCLEELKTRFIVNLPQFTVRVIRSTGIEESVLVV